MNDNTQAIREVLQRFYKNPGFAPVMSTLFSNPMEPDKFPSLDYVVERLAPIVRGVHTKKGYIGADPAQPQSEENMLLYDLHNRSEILYWNVRSGGLRRFAAPPSR